MRIKSKLALVLALAGGLLLCFVLLDRQQLDKRTLQFQEDQVAEEEIREPGRGQPRQLRVIPLREGRVFVNVSAEVQTAGGAMIRSMAIPLRVGAAPDGPVVNRAMAEGPDGEAVITMPADERED